MKEHPPTPGEPTKGGEEHFTRVQWRIMQLELPLLLLLFVCLLFWLTAALKDELHASNLEHAQQTAQAATSAVEASMKSQQALGIWERVDQRLSPGQGVRVHFINPQAEVSHSTDSAMQGHAYRLGDPPCASCHEGGSKTATAQTAFPKGPDGTRSSVYVAPLRNREECRSCHPNDGAKLGMVYVEHSFEGAERLIGRTRNGLIATVTVGYLLTLLISGFVTRRYIDLPVKRLLKGAREIGAGNLDSTVELPVKSELSVLADTFNQSTKQLRESIQQTERQRDDLKHLYFIAEQLGQSVEPDERRRLAVELVGNIFQCDSLLIAGHFHRESGVFDGTLTYRDGDSEIVEVVFHDTEGMPAISFCVPAIVDRWLEGELEEGHTVREGATVAYPLERRGRRLGLIMAPALKVDEYADGRATAANPLVVRAFLRHLAIALNLSQLRRVHQQQARLAAIGGIVAGLSHCLKNTLNGLRGGLYVVDRAMETGKTDRLERGWKVLRGSVRQIERLTLDMLFFSREHQPDLKLADPNQILQEIVDLLNQSAASQGVTVSAEFDKNVGKMRLDRMAIYRAVLNLASNAVDACSDSEDRGDSVVLRSLAISNALLIAVEDNGVGMDERTQKRMYEQFFSTKMGRGTGLGLPVVMKILEEQGGSLVVESALGEGTTFTIRLPKAVKES